MLCTQFVTPYSELLGLIQLEHFAEVSLETVLESVSHALDETPEEEPHRDWLIRLEQALEQGEDCRQELLEFARGVLGKLQPPALALESEYQRLLEQFSEDQWQSPLYQDFDENLEDEDFLDEWEANLERVAAEYASTPLLPSELTAEAYVSHQLMQRSFESWRKAIQCARAQEDDQALQEAETACRSMAAVEHLRGRVEAAARLSQ